jgi:hypothetical protein
MCKVDVSSVKYSKLRSTMKIIDIELNPDHEDRGGEWLEVANMLHKKQIMKKHFAHQELELLKRLKELSEDCSSKGGDFVFTKIVSKGNIDYSKIKELKKVDLEQYRKEDIAKWKLTKI